MITIRLYPRSGGGLGSAMRFILRLLEIKDKVRLVKLNDDDGKLETLKTIFLIPDSKLEIVHDSNEIESILKQEQIIWDENFMRDISHNSFTTKDNKYFPDKKDLANYHRRMDLYNRYKLIFPDDIARWTIAPKAAPIIQAYPPPPPKLAKKFPRPPGKIFGHTDPIAT